MGTAHLQGDLCQVAPRMVVGESSSWCSIGRVRYEPLVAHAETSTHQSGLQLWQLAMCQEVQPPPDRGVVGYSLVLHDSPDELRGRTPGNPVSTRAEWGPPLGNGENRAVGVSGRTRQCADSQVSAVAGISQ